MKSKTSSLFKFSLHVSAVEMPVMEPNAPEFADEYSEDTWHFTGDVKPILRVRIKDDTRNKIRVIEAPGKPTLRTLSKALHRAAEEITRYCEETA